MKSEIEAAIKVLIGEVKSGMKADEALKLTQAVLNLAQTAATMGLIVYPNLGISE